MNEFYYNVSKSITYHMDIGSTQIYKDYNCNIYGAGLPPGVLKEEFSHFSAVLKYRADKRGYVVRDLTLLNGRLRIIVVKKQDNIEVIV